MTALLFTVLALASPPPLPPTPPCPAGSYLYEPAFCLDDVYVGKAHACLPQPGDIMLRLDKSVFWRITHWMAFAFDPNGSAIVFARPDGSLAVLEAGPNDTLWVRTLDLLPHLKEYADAGRVWIRRRKVPLTREQSAALTAFAMKADGKRFALIRLGGQLTVLRSRGPLRTWVLGKPKGDKSTYFCSELVCEACVAAGLFDPKRTRPSATYPRDLFFGDSYNPFLNRNLEVNDHWYPPARWVERPITP
jgi:hypothetical protein